MNSGGIRWLAQWVEGLGRLTLLAREAVASLLTFKVTWRDLLFQVYFVGVKSQSVVLITGAFTGMVLAAQTFLQFHKVKMDTATLAVVSVSMCSELGPVLTRLMALYIALPLLTAESIAVGIGAGYLVSVYLLAIDPTYSWYNMLKYTNTSDVVVGVIKSFIFGGIIAMIGCYKGMTCGEGAEGVGRATTEAVVFSSITILITNFFLTLVLGQIFQKV